MRKVVMLVLAVFIISGCKTKDKAVTDDPVTGDQVTDELAEGENPETEPEIELFIEEFDPDPDAAEVAIPVQIAINHPAEITEYTVTINPQRQRQGQGREQRPPQEEGQPEAERPQRTEGEGRGQGRARGPFYQENFQGSPPAVWYWNGRSNRESSMDEMAQSASAYRFVLTARDRFGNESSQEGTIDIGVFVDRDGDNLRISVTDIVFPGNSSDLSLVAEERGEEAHRENRRILRLIARVLNSERYEDYKITVEGHANPSHPEGSQSRINEEPFLRRVSQERAQAVVDYLISEHNVESSRLTAVGMGSSQTKGAYDDDEESWKNRRVEFLLER